MHPNSDYIGYNVPVRDFDGVYMLGNTGRVPGGVVRFDSKDLLEIL